jgi:glutathione S-transferase
MLKLIIGNKNYSSWSLRAWLMLKHFELEFEEIRIPLDTENTMSQIARYSDAGKVPVLRDADLEIWDSLAICEYVSERHLDGRGWPADPAVRAQARSASAEMHSSFTALRSEMPMNCRALRRIECTPACLRDITRIDRLWSELRRRYGADQPWLCGDFSIVDCMFAPVVARFNTYRPQLSEVAQVYVETLLQHPSMLEWYRQAYEESEILPNEEVGKPI